MAEGRYPKFQPFSAAAFLYDPVTQSLLLHLRDGNAPEHPNSWAFFGGRGEAGETDVDCCLRELKEEIGLTLQSRDLQRVREYLVTDPRDFQITFYAEKAIPLDQLVLSEGAGFAWEPLTDAERTGFDSELWGDAEQMLQAFRRTAFSALIFRLADSDRFVDLSGNGERAVAMERDRERVDTGGQGAVRLRLADAGVGALCARTAVLGAYMNVRINAAGCTDSEYVKFILSEGSAMEKQALEAEVRIRSIVDKQIDQL